MTSTWTHPAWVSGSHRPTAAANRAVIYIYDMGRNREEDKRKGERRDEEKERRRKKSTQEEKK